MYSTSGDCWRRSITRLSSRCECVLSNRINSISIRLSHPHSCALPLWLMSQTDLRRPYLHTGLTHVFDVCRYGSFQDESRLYMLLEFVPGGELFGHLRAAGRFTLSAARFYTACVVSALDHLHSHDIVYRYRCRWSLVRILLLVGSGPTPCQKTEQCSMSTTDLPVQFATVSLPTCRCQGPEAGESANRSQRLRQAVRLRLRQAAGPGTSRAHLHPVRHARVSRAGAGLQRGPRQGRRLVRAFRALRCIHK